MNQKKIVSTLLGVAALTLLSGCGSSEEAPQQTPEKNTEAKPLTEEKGEKNIITKEEMEAFIFAEGFDSQEYYKTLKESTAIAQMNIINQEVHNLKSAESCNKLPDTSRQNSCKDGFYMSQANEKNDATLCEKLSQEESVKFCKQNILLQEARTSGDIAICEQVTEKYAQQKCKNSIYIEAARKTGDPSSCKNIEVQGDKIMCEQEAKFAADEQKRIAEMKKQEEIRELQRIEAAAQSEESTPTAEDVPAEAVEIIEVPEIIAEENTPA